MNLADMPKFPQSNGSKNKYGKRKLNRAAGQFSEEHNVSQLARFARPTRSKNSTNSIRSGSLDRQAGQDTSWQKVAGWYDQKLKHADSYFHEKIVLPKVLNILNLNSGSTLLDLACGQGILATKVKVRIKQYVGIDLAPDLIAAARKTRLQFPSDFQVGDVSLPLNIKGRFTAITVLLALQNIENAKGLFANIAKHLDQDGQAVIVINHPMFRIPRQTSWQIIDKLQFRRVNMYMSQLRIPIDMTPGQAQRKVTWSFHRPLSEYAAMIKAHGLVIADIQEWISEKSSEGPAAKMENRAREEFPMFMTLVLKHAA